jgi:hypothetical protein
MNPPKQPEKAPEQAVCQNEEKLLQKCFSGRPSLFDAKIAALIVRQVRSGSSFSQAALVAGVDRVTIGRWRKRHLKFDRACRQAARRHSKRRYGGPRRELPTKEIPDVIRLSLDADPAQIAKNWSALGLPQPKEGGKFGGGLEVRLFYAHELDPDYAPGTGNKLATLRVLPPPTADCVSVKQPESASTDATDATKGAPEPEPQLQAATEPKPGSRKLAAARLFAAVRTASDRPSEVFREMKRVRYD